jgi:GntR family transcriptional regulator, transcriptional repressor for pyruvate dehydrogenase complex
MCNGCGVFFGQVLKHQGQRHQFWSSRGDLGIESAMRARNTMQRVTDGKSTRSRPKTKATDEIIDSIRSDIVTGRIPLGERMPSERELAEDFGVSQPTVREALRALEILGLVEVHHGSGTFTSGRAEYAVASALLTLMQLQNVGVMEVQMVRQILGIESAKLAAMTATYDQIAEIDSAITGIDTLSHSSPLPDIFRALLDHQKSMAAASNNALLSALENFLAMLMIELQAGLVEVRKTGFWCDRIQSLQPFRKQVLDAIRKREPANAKAAAGLYYGEVQTVFEGDSMLKRARLSDPNLQDSVKRLMDDFKSNPN